MRWRTLETAAWLALYAGILIFLFGWNTASPMYNAIYRDRSAADWLPESDRAYEPGTTITGTAPSPYFDGGWWRPEAEFRWGRGTRSGLVIVPTRTMEAGSRIVAELAVFPLRMVREYRVDVIVNGETLGKFAVGNEKRSYEIVLPFALPAEVPATIVLQSQFAKSPVSQGYGLDQRELSVQFFDLVVLPPP